MTQLLGHIGPLADPDYIGPLAVQSPAQISFDFQVGIDQEICYDLEGWSAWHKNGAVWLHSPCEGLLPQGMTATQLCVVLRTLTPSSALYPLTPSAGMKGCPGSSGHPTAHGTRCSDP